MPLHTSGPSPPLSPAAKQLQHILGSKQPIAHKEESIKNVLRVIKACSKEELAALGLQPPPLPTLSLADLSEHRPLAARLQAVQAFISSFQYNHSTGYNYNTSKRRPLQSVLAEAAGILAHPLPIKCIEAVFLGILITQGWAQLQRLPLGFKSRGCDGQVYRHIVLAVCDISTGLFGALGLSRCSQLMDKQLQHASLAALVGDYMDAYRHVQHELLKVRVGLPVEHDPAWTGPVCWRFCTVNTQRRSWQEAAALLNKHAAAAHELQRQYRECAAAAAAAAAGSSGTTATANSSSSSKCVQSNSPRGTPPAVGPHITRPYSALRVRTAAAAEPPTEHQHLPAVKSPQQHQRSGAAGAWRSPACTSPASPRHPHTQIRPSPVTSPSATRAGAASPAACKRLLDNCADVHSSCDCCESSEDEGNDTDSEVSTIIQQLLQHRVG